MSELLFRDDAYRRSCNARVVAIADGAIELDATVFYPAGGGQPGDSGELRLADGSRVRIADTRKSEPGERVLHVAEPGERVLHVAEPGVTLPAVGALVEASIDWERRHRHMRLHTCLHLLCAIVPAPVTGGRIAEDKAHLDFDIEMDKLDKQTIETKLNALIAAGGIASARWIEDAELDARPELVRTMSVAPPRGSGRVRLIEIPGVDLQPCGGTHVAEIAEIGRVQVSRIRSEGKRNKRVTLVFA